MDSSHHGHMGHMDHMPATENSTGTPMPGHDMGDMTMEMQMYFYAGYEATILFQKWKTESVGGLIGSMVGIFLMAMIYEGIKFFRDHLYRRSYPPSYKTVTSPGMNNHMVNPARHSVRYRILNYHHFLQTLLHVVQVTLSYFLMLIFMTYNVYLCIAVVAGAGVGFFMFGWRKSIVVDITEHCH